MKNKKTKDKRHKSLKLISITSAILFIVVVMVVNFFFDNLLGEKLRWDWSQTDLYSIGEVTKEIIGNLDKDVEIIGLYEEGNDPLQGTASINILIDKYVSESKGRIKVIYTDPIKNPGILKELDPDELIKPEFGNYVVRCKETGKVKLLSPYDLVQISYDEYYQQRLDGIIAEEAFSGAIRFVVSENTPVIYTTTGHDEADMDRDFTLIKRLMENNNYLVKEFNLFSADSIPEDASLIIMLNPVKDITQREKKLLEDYLREGKSLFILMDYSNTSYDVLNELLLAYNIEITNNRIREGDQERRFLGNEYIFLADAKAGLITEENLDAMTIVINPREIKKIKNEKEYINTEEFLITGNKALAEIGGDQENTGEAGIKNLALATEHTGYINWDTVKEPTKVLVVGNYLHLADAYAELAQNAYNYYSFYESVAWLAGETDEKLPITAKKLPGYQLTKGSPTAYTVTAVILVLVLPILMLVIALVVFRKRRNL